ncbi:MAG TPA: hypothetical protein DHV28_03470 [Ignavibacteriales bacterium]|nr:hypothetical protein [Ignavibacteriales bacterium]
MKKFGLLIIFFCTISTLNAQISLTGVGTYTQDFNSLAGTGTSSTLPTGWYLSESGTSANTLYTAGSGSNNTGDTYSFGTTFIDRAFGGLRSGSLIPVIGASFTNNTGSAITQISITYTGEQWRAGVLNRGAADRLDFQLSTDAASLTTGTWTDYDALDFYSPNINTTLGAKDGNSAENRTIISFTITGLNIINGATFWIRWTDFDITSTDDALAIDDFSIDQSALPVELSSFSATTIGSIVKLNWQTETEVNNYGFDILRQAEDEKVWTKIGFVNGYGNSNSPRSYSYEDKNLPGGRQGVTAGKYAYRLKQIDNDGQFEYSKVIEVDFGAPKKFELSQNYPNPFNPVTTIRFNLSEAGNVKITLFNILGQEIKTIVNDFKESGVHTINFDASDLNSGMYIYKLESGSFIQTRKMTLVK